MLTNMLTKQEDDSSKAILEAVNILDEAYAICDFKCLLESIVFLKILVFNIAKYNTCRCYNVQNILAGVKAVFVSIKQNSSRLDAKAAIRGAFNEATNITISADRETIDEITRVIFSLEEAARAFNIPYLESRLNRLASNRDIMSEVFKFSKENFPDNAIKPFFARLLKYKIIMKGLNCMLNIFRKTRNAPTPTPQEEYNALRINQVNLSNKIENFKAAQNEIVKKAIGASELKKRMLNRDYVDLNKKIESAMAEFNSNDERMNWLSSIISQGNQTPVYTDDEIREMEEKSIQDSLKADELAKQRQIVNEFKQRQIVNELNNAVPASTYSDTLDPVFSTLISGQPASESKNNINEREHAE